METLTVKQYAAVRGLKPASMMDIIAEGEEHPDATAETPLPVKFLEQIAGFIDDDNAEELLDSLEGVQDARANLADAESVLRSSVKAAFKDGLSGARIGEILGLSKARVYQIRDGKR